MNKVQLPAHTDKAIKASLIRTIRANRPEYARVVTNNNGKRTLYMIMADRTVLTANAGKAAQ